MAYIERVVVTGALGFIGSHFVKHLLQVAPEIRVIGLARNTDQRNLRRIDGVVDNPRFKLVYRDLNDPNITEDIENVDVVVNFAAKTFVDYSVRDPKPFMESNILGTFNLLEAARKNQIGTFVQIGTDEVYGPITVGEYKEDAQLAPTNPYSATKAAADMLALSYAETYCMPILVTRTENNYGPYQHRQKVMPAWVALAMQDKPIKIYGQGKQKRMWLRVEDHVDAIWFLIENGARGIYHIAGGQELENNELAQIVLDALGKPATLLEHIDDSKIRPSHDTRYALNTDKLKQLGWKPKWDMRDGIADSIRWYRDNPWWLV